MMVRIAFLVFLSVFLFSSDIISQTVYITKTGKKYHSSNCSFLSKSKIAIELNKAIERGFTACSKCKPPQKVEGTNKQNFTPESKDQVKPKTNITSQQCEAITKKGTRCSRKAQAGSKYCWQHQK